MSSFKEAPGSKDAQDQIIKGDLDRDSKIKDVALGAVALDLATELIPDLTVALKDLRRDRHLTDLTGLTVHQLQLAVELRIELALIEEVDDDRLELVVAQIV